MTPDLIAKIKDRVMVELLPALEQRDKIEVRDTRDDWETIEKELRVKEVAKRVKKKKQRQVMVPKDDSDEDMEPVQSEGEKDDDLREFVNLPGMTSSHELDQCYLAMMKKIRKAHEEQSSEQS